MRQNAKRAISFILALTMLLYLNVGVAFADEVTGILPGDHGFIAEITEIVVDYDSNPEDPYVRVKGYVTSDGEFAGAAGQPILGSILGPKLDAEFNPGQVQDDLSFEVVVPVTSDHQQTVDGRYKITITNGEHYDGTYNGDYSVYFNIKDDQVVEDWTEEKQLYEVTVSPSAVELSDAVYNTTPVGIDIQTVNSGLDEITNVKASISGAGFTISPDSPVASLKSGETADYTITPENGLTPGAYTAELIITATGASNDDTTAEAIISFKVTKADNPGTLPDFTTVAATTVGGLGKITGLEAEGKYDVLSTDENGSYTTWTSITASATGEIEITPGSFQIRLPETDFYLPGDPSNEFVVNAYYHFSDVTYENIKAGTYQEFDLNEQVNGGSGTKSYAITGGGILPEGLELDPLTGIISGTPSALTTGSISISVEVTDTDEGVKAATVTFDKIIKGDQATPGAIGLEATDHIINITGGAFGQLYYTSTDSALSVFSEELWTSKTAIEGLDRNTQYYVYSKLPATELLNESPISSPSSIRTQKTTITAVEITKSAVDSTTMIAIVTPTDAAVEYQWMLDGSPIDHATGPAINTDAADMAGKEISVLVKGSGDFQGNLTSTGIMIGGKSIVLAVQSWNPKVPVTALLTNEDGTAITCTAISSTSAGIENGLTAQSITIQNVRPNQSYKLVLSKKGCTDVVVTGISVVNDNVIFGTALNNRLIMHCGDLNGDNSIRLEDRAMLLMSHYYNQKVADFTGDSNAEMRDFNGDGSIDFQDLLLLMGSINYGMDREIIPYSN